MGWDLIELEIFLDKKCVLAYFESEMLSHSHPLFWEDNSEVYFLLKEATRGTSYAASIKPFQRMKNGRDAYLALVGQYAGKDKW